MYVTTQSVASKTGHLYLQCVALTSLYVRTYAYCTYWYRRVTRFQARSANKYIHTVERKSGKKERKLRDTDVAAAAKPSPLFLCGVFTFQKFFFAFLLLMHLLREGGREKGFLGGFLGAIICWQAWVSDDNRKVEVVHQEMHR